MKHSLLRSIALVAATPLLAVAASHIADDQTLMTVGRQNVTIGEYNRMLRKNGGAAATDNETPAQRLNRFALYKMKVQAARDAGLDTLAAHRSELETYRRELAAPYMFDREMRDSLVAAAYDHAKKKATVTHLWFQPRTDQEHTAMAQRADSIRKAVLAGADFDEIVARLAGKPGSPVSGGTLTITAAMSPYEFEDAAFTTPVGHLSPVFTSAMGLHLVRPDKIEVNPGEVKVRHILRRFKDATLADSAQAHATIDSLAQLLAAGADFATLARQYTEDPSGQQTGGDLPWFGIGRMVPEFEQAAFALAPGQVSAPVRTAYGYHLLLKEGQRAVAPIDSMRKDIENQISRDKRFTRIHTRAAVRYAAAEGISLNHAAMERARKMVADAGRIDSAMLPQLRQITLFVIDGNPHTAADALAELAQSDKPATGASANTAMQAYYQRQIQERMFQTLPQREPEYANMAQAYDDDLLVYEISNREVWDRANTDTEGLEKYFAKHRKDFRWDRPHYIGWVISAENDSLADLAAKHIETLPADARNLQQELRKNFGNKVKIDQVNSAAGQYPIIDYVAFEGERPAANGRWKAFRAVRGAVVEQPRSAADVKGQAGMAYQKQLEDQWLKRLRKQYPVKINKQAAKQID